MRRRLTWLVILPLALTGGVCGHAVVNVLLGAPFGPESELFVPGGLGAELVPALLALAGAVLLLVLCGRILGLGGLSRTGVSALPFACLTPLVFVLQEHLEAALHGGGVLGVALEPMFVPGLAVQFPFALAAYLIARGLLRLADGVRRMLAAARPPVVAADGATSKLLRPEIVERRRAGLLGSSHAGRAPPPPAAARG
jgi:hypothetical protein